MEDTNFEWTTVVAEHKIQEAMEAGQFRNLRGSGEPLDESVLATSVFDRFTGRVMKESEALPEWVQLQKDIDSEMEQLHPARARILRVLRRTANPATRTRIAERLRTNQRERLETANLMILKYNMSAPGAASRVFRSYRVKDEMAALETEIADASRGDGGAAGR